MRDELQAAQPMNPHVTFKVTTVDDLGIKPKDNNLRGGGYFNLADGTPWCTAGFNVISETGVKGTTTAKHCADDPYLIYLNHPARDDNRTTVSRMYRAPDYDIARYQGGDLTYTRTFYYELNLPRYATNWSVPAVTNIPMCTFGRTSATQGLGARCGKVTQLSVGWDDGFEDNFETDTSTLGGDSGGPAYWGGTAYGILYAGEDPPGSVLHSYHAKVWNIPKAGGFGTANPWQVWTCNTC
ncbi:S1 family peptidase [Nonomuraea cavernae]|uniref:S1 family peptidase n=1 Tax=Nonomuraea cavernae TaxID=2045107 RepID=UPI0033C673BF